MILPLNTARGAAAEDALVDLVARAVRFRVIDRRVIVDQAIAVGEIEAVQRDLRPFAVERGQHVVANEPAAKRKRVRREVRAAGRVHVHGPEMERLLAFLLHLVVIEHGVLAGEDLGDRVGEIGGAARPT